MTTDDDHKRYKIVRYYFNGRKATRRSLMGLTLEQAQKHCQDPKTRKAGVWFDGYTEDK